MNLMGCHSKLAFLASVSSLMTTGIAFAQSPTITENNQSSPAQEPSDAEATSKFDVIYVTAQKKQERLLDVPQSVTALSSENLEKLAATQFRDFANTIPGLSFRSAGAGSTQVTLRGVTAGTDVSSTVGTYVDEVPYGSSTSFGRNSRYSPDGNLSNLSRVEVLRGPQGTLYGASSMGGLIKYVSKAPEADTFFGEAGLGVSTTHKGGTNYNLSGALNIPLAADKAALRISAYNVHDAGFIDNVALGQSDVNASDMYGARADLLLTPNEALSVRLAVEIQNVDRDGTAEADYSFGYRDSEPLAGELSQVRAVEEPFRQEFSLYSATVKYDFGPAELISVTSYQETETENTFDYTPAGIFGPGETALTDDPSTKKFTQEVRLESSAGDFLDYSVGAFYTNEDSDRYSEVIYAPGGTVVPGIYALSAPSTYEEVAAFGNLTVHVTDKLDITGGLRVAQNDQTYSQTGEGFAATREESSADEDVVTYLASARYALGEQSNVYARYATGYRPGGPNFFAAGIDTDPSFDSDTLDSYEVGYKAELANGALGIETALYHLVWKDIQTFDSSSPFGGYVNGPRAEIDGAEVSLTARPGDALTLTGALAYQNARLTESDPNLSAAKGDTLPNVPTTTLTVSGDYELDVASYRPTLGATVRYVGDRESTFSLSESLRKVSSYTQVDLRLAFDLGETNAQLYVHNLFDERGEISSYSADGLPPRVAIIQPRTIGFRTSLDF